MPGRRGSRCARSATSASPSRRPSPLVFTPAIPVAEADPVSDVQRWASCYPWLVEDTARLADAWYQYASEMARQTRCKLKFRPLGVSFSGDSSFRDPRTGGPNLAAGVTGGSGTANDPYVIGSHEWRGSCPAIQIRDTEAHVRIENNWFHDMPCILGAVYLTNSDHVTVSNRFSAVKWGVEVQTWGPAAGMDFIHVEHNLFEDTYTPLGVDGAALAAAGVRPATTRIQYGIVANGSAAAHVNDNVFRKGPGAIPGPVADYAFIAYGSNLEAYGNNVESVAARALQVWYAPGRTIVWSLTVGSAPEYAVSIEATGPWQTDVMFSNIGGGVHVKNG